MTVYPPATVFLRKAWHARDAAPRRRRECLVARRNHEIDGRPPRRAVREVRGPKESTPSNSEDVLSRTRGELWQRVPGRAGDSIVADPSPGKLIKVRGGSMLPLGFAYVCVRKQHTLADAHTPLHESECRQKALCCTFEVSRNTLFWQNLSRAYSTEFHGSFLGAH